MSDFSHLFCFYPRLPTWSTWASELRYHISHVSCLLYTCPALFITALSAPGVCCQAGPGSFRLTSAIAECMSLLQAVLHLTLCFWSKWELKKSCKHPVENSEETRSQSSSQGLQLLTSQEDKREFNW